MRASLLLLASLSPLTAAPPDKLDDLVVRAHDEEPQLVREGDFAIPLPAGRGFQEAIPGMPNLQQGTPSSTAFTLRGLGQDNVIFSIGTQSNTLVNFTNGGLPGSASTLTSVTPLLWDIGEVEVTRGPVLFGRGLAVMGGEFRLEPNVPQFHHEGRLTGEIGDYGSWRAGITENVVLVPDKLALRLNAVGEGTNNDVTNLYDGNERFAETQRSSYRGQLRWLPAGNEQTVVDLRVDLERGRGNFFGQAFLVPGHDLYDRVVDVNTTASLPSDLWGVVLRTHTDLGQDWWIDTEATAQNLDGSHYTDLDGGSVLKWFYNYIVDERRFTANTRFGHDGEKLKWFGGLYAESSEYDVIFQGVGLGPVPQGRVFFTPFNEDVSIAAAFIHGDLALGCDFWLNGGVRLDYQSREMSTAAELGGVVTGTSYLEADYTEWLPELGLEWRHDQLTAGAKVSRSYRPGAASVAPSLGVASPYGPERGWETNLFVEQKWECLRAGGRIFYAKLRDQQVPYIPTGGIPIIDSFITNGAKSQRAGAEVELAWESGAFAAGLTAGYLYAEYDELVLNGVDRSSQSFPLSPEWTVGLGMRWSPKVGWFGEISMNWADTCYSQVDSPLLTKLEARTLLSARGGYRWEKVEAYIFGSNLLDEDYAMSKSDYSAVGIPVSAKLGMPVVLGTGMTVTW